MSVTRVTAFAPASVANVAVGFDLLGFSVDSLGDHVTLEKINTPEIIIQDIEGQTTDIPKDAEKNTATAGLVRLCKDLKLNFGFNVSIKKGIPLGSGLGGSAASAVAALVAANEFLDPKLSKNQLLSYALIGEYQASQSYHADNLAPSLFGGLVLSRILESAPNSIPLAQVTEIPIPKDLYCTLLLPKLVLETKMARGILKDNISLQSFIRQSGYLAEFIACCYSNRAEAMKFCLNDVVIEPQRSHLIPFFKEAKALALKSGALGFSISGAGPCLFALSEKLSTAHLIQKELELLYQKKSLPVSSWALELNTQGSRVIS